MFRGAYTALVTPFRDDRVDEEALRRLVRRQIEGGIHGLVPCGTTGESPVLTVREHLRVVEVTMEAAEGKVPVLAGAGGNCTDEALELTRGCKALGVAGTLQITPYYNKPPQEGIARHILTLADVGLPIVLYNVPGRTVTDLLPETVGRLAQHPLVVGIKEATGQMQRVVEIRERCGPDFDLLSGDDFSCMPFMAAGGHGVISVGSNLLPSLFARMCDAVAAGRLDEARELNDRQMPLTRALFSVASPMPLKAALAHLGLAEPEIRSPLYPLPGDSPEFRELERQLRNLELVP